MFGNTVRVVLWSLVLVRGVQLVVSGARATAEGIKMPDNK
jgi:hypothetical protein